MSHLDDGILNAYLDGEVGTGGAEGADLLEVQQHLARCTECRARLQEARRVRDRAASILSASGPGDVAIPPFEEVRARSRAHTAGDRVLQLNRMKALAWAATVVLAVAVGWYARATLAPTGQERFVSEGDTRGADPTKGPAIEAAAYATAESASADTKGRTESRAEPDEEAAAGAAEVQRGGEVRTDEAPPVGGVLAAPNVAATPPREPRAGEPVQAARATAPPAEADVVVAEIPESVAQRLLAQVGVVDSATAPPHVEGEMYQARQRAVAAGGAVVTQVAAEAVAGDAPMWHTVDRATAETILGQEVPVVEGLPVLGYASATGEVARAVLVRQQLDSLDVLEIVLQRESQAAALDAAKKVVATDRVLPGRRGRPINMIDIQRSGLRVTLRAAVPYDSLIVLAENVRPH